MNKRRTVKKHFNFMTSRQLEQTFNESDIVLALGLYYIMDLVRLGKSLLYPSGQYEQLYLAKKLQEEGLAPYAEQDDFKIDYLPQIKSIVDCSTLQTLIGNSYLVFLKFKIILKLKNLVLILIVYIKIAPQKLAIFILLP
jgi:hypothetical protein